MTSTSNLNLNLRTVSSHNHSQLMNPVESSNDRAARRASNKVRDLHGVLDRLLHAHQLTLQQGYTKRAHSYASQATAVRTELAQWHAILHSHHQQQHHRHLFIVAGVVFEACVRRLSDGILIIVVLYVSVLMSYACAGFNNRSTFTSRSNTVTPTDIGGKISKVTPWSHEIASLKRNTTVSPPALAYAMRRSLL